MSQPILPIADMSQRHHGLTDSIAEHWTEGARVCLDRHHCSPVDFTIGWDADQLNALAIWSSTDERIKNAWANTTDATEAGAYACVLAAVELMGPLVAVRRAETETGADYYVAPLDATPHDWERFIRLEVSGVDSGNAATISRRLNDKLQQAASGNSNLPAMAGVVGFQSKLIRLGKVE
ncbi:MAG: hypothetical protein OXF79_21020 [Chloroflexi bacterium]|nr:hypothetical protein [Chloroflexota bacterium]